MTTPPLLMTAGLVFWGWQTGHLITAAALAAVIEGAGLASYRWAFSFSDYSRAADFCTVLLMGFSVYFFFTLPVIDILLAVILWLPLVFLPLMAVQQYGLAESVDLRAFFILGRKSFKEERSATVGGINLTYPYLGICLLSAAAANNRDPRFYVGMAMLSAWALFPLRSRRYPLAAWLLLLSAAAGTGYIGHKGLHGLQLFIEEKGPEWFANLTQRDNDPFRNRTAIGEIGKLKLSERILFRVKTKGAYRLPILLRESTFNVYRYTTWYARKAAFTRLSSENGGRTWRWAEPASGGDTLIVHMPVRFGKSLIKLPRHTRLVEELPVSVLEVNRLGTVRATGGPGMVTYKVRSGGDFSFLSPPDDSDRMLSAAGREIFYRVAETLKLKSKSPEGMLAAVQSFFQDNFRYSLNIASESAGASPIAAFLLDTRAGHCEYFATAGVMLLRAAGLPARYVSGYSVQEFSRLEKQFVVRARHAHAWVQVFHHGTWHDFDPTPSVWRELENDAAPFFQPVSDLFSLLGHQISMWRWQTEDGTLSWKFGWIPLCLLLYLGWRLKKRKAIRRSRHPVSGPKTPLSVKGSDSPFFMVERRLNRMGFIRPPGDTYKTWIDTIDHETDGSVIGRQEVACALEAHYQYRFDPKGIDGEDAIRLKQEVAAWLDRVRP